jgi:hypothetical protein
MSISKQSPFYGVYRQSLRPVANARRSSHNVFRRGATTAIRRPGLSPTVATGAAKTRQAVQRCIKGPEAFASYPSWKIWDAKIWGAKIWGRHTDSWVNRLWLFVCTEVESAFTRVDRRFQQSFEFGGGSPLGIWHLASLELIRDD